MPGQPKSTIRVALAQTWPVSACEGPPKLEKPHSSHPFPTLQQNLDKAEECIVRAAKDEAEVVVFPEYFLQGIVNEGRQYLCYPSTHLTSQLQTLAKRHSIAIVGTIVHYKPPDSLSTPLPSDSPFDPPSSSSKAQHHQTPAQLEWAKYLESHPSTAEENSEPILHNTAFFIDDTGALLGEYVKRNLWHPEREYLTGGEDHSEVFETKWGKVGLLICWDISHPAASQVLTDKGVEIIFAPIYWLSTDSEPMIHNHKHDETYERQLTSALCFARAFETESLWVMCNAGGDELQGFMGGSGVWAPFRGRVDGMDYAKEDLKVVDVDLGVLKDGRNWHKIREDYSKRQAT